jgi:pre-mRNA 3'-end-processing factor FIP1
LTFPYSDTRRQTPLALSPHDTRKATATPVSITKHEQPPDRKHTPSSNEKPGTDYPARHTSNIDPNANPVHSTTGKPILSTDFDTDFPTESSKPWRKPGSDISDYFNYGFDEFTWASYCLKQQQMPKEISEIKAQADFMKSFVEGIPGGGAPGMPGVTAGAATQGAGAAMPAIPGMPNEAEMQQRFMSMMERGVDPSSMSAEQFMQQMMGGGGQGFSGQGQGFGGMGGGGQQQQPQMGFGGGAGGGGGFDQGGNFGKGRGRGRRGW